MVNKDTTGNDRQRRRREREKVWLKEHGFQSWEALHTALMNGETSLTPRVPDAGDSVASQALSPQSGESTPEVDPAASQRR